MSATEEGPAPLENYLPPRVIPIGATKHTLICSFATIIAFGLSWVGACHAQPWPSRTVRLIAPFSPGGGVDTFARIVGQKLQEQLGQQVVVENRPGASGMIGANVVAKAPPDGYTVLISSAGEITINQHLYSKIPYDPVTDLAPVSYAAHTALLLSVHRSVPVKSLKELIVLAKARPGQLTYGSAGTGSPNHLAGELFGFTTKIDIVHVPYKGGGAAVIDMVGGQVPMGVTALPATLPHVRAGRLRAIAVATGERSKAAPDLPTFVELGFPDIVIVNWFGILVPARTPTEVISRLSTELLKAMNASNVKARLLEQGIEVVGTSPDQFAQFIRSEIALYAKLVKQSGAKLD